MPGVVLDKGELAMTVNGLPRQKSDIAKLIWNIPELICDLSKFYHLQPHLRARPRVSVWRATMRASATEFGTARAPRNRRVRIP